MQYAVCKGRFFKSAKISKKINFFKNILDKQACYLVY